MMEELFQMKNGDRICRDGDVSYVFFTGKRRVLSTAAANGGYQEQLDTLFNYDCCHDGTVSCQMLAPTLKEHMEKLAVQFGLDPKRAAGGSTAVPMKCLVVETESFGELQVTAAVTAGLQGNGGRVGDPAALEERDGQMLELPNGTIHIYLMIDGNLSPETMARAIVTATEAKVAAIQELGIRSRYSMGLATGSGTDKIFVVSDPKSARCLTDAGKHTKLGELIGNTVRKATKRSLQMKLREDEKSPLYPLKNFGWTKRPLPGKPGMQGAILMFCHLLDQLSWEKLSFDEVIASAEGLFQAFGLDIQALQTCKEKGKDLAVSEQIQMLAECFREA